MQVCKYAQPYLSHLIWNHLVTKSSFRHNLNEAPKEKTDLKIFVEEYAHMMEMLCRPLNMESVGHKMPISSERYWCL